ncbi:MAG: CPBP family intramembrane metalloprotease [Acidobacteriia bacterium]|nr:CPBP family intramembrane metalloprotease [Terriglobia bacterium]
MTPFDNDPLNSDISSADPSAAPGGGAPPASPLSALPEDMRISWSWPHFAVFLVFSIGNFVVTQVALVSYLTSYRHMTIKEIQSAPSFVAPYLVATQVLFFALELLFLYVTLGLLPDAPFWRSVGWRRLPPGPSRGRGWLYFFSGCGLAICVAVASLSVHPKEKLPIEELFKDRTSTALLMLMAVLVAPLIEETVFRGYLYPLFARSFGVPAAIGITGVLFGILHGAQLGWTRELVVMMSLVGMVFTYGRARARTVLGSYLLHLGYNSMISVTMLIATRGLQHFPPAT